ncbi:MAG TPA: zinc ribbon domain-containing protein [Blastocatellia bacterium]|nr:zinc ribbon domain-containing protein [Blastocatellia bacterium]
MFCPKCGAQDHDQAKFCRTCGTDLRSVVWALTGQPPLPAEAGQSGAELSKPWMKLQGDGIQRTVQGLLVLITGVLLGIPLSLFRNEADWGANWIVIWLIFCGWIPVCGAVMMGTGLSNLIQAGIMRRRIERQVAVMDSLAMPPAAETRKIPGTSAPPSIGEHTTAPLVKPQDRL